MSIIIAFANVQGVQGTRTRDKTLNKYLLALVPCYKENVPKAVKNAISGISTRTFTYASHAYLQYRI